MKAEEGESISAVVIKAYLKQQLDDLAGMVDASAVAEAKLYK